LSFFQNEWQLNNDVYNRRLNMCMTYFAFLNGELRVRRELWRY
jgi:hypothetical protein